MVLRFSCIPQRLLISETASHHSQFDFEVANWFELGLSDLSPLSC